MDPTPERQQYSNTYPWQSRESKLSSDISHQQPHAGLIVMFVGNLECSNNCEAKTSSDCLSQNWYTNYN